MTRLKCGVIGLGRLGFKHAQTLAGRIPEAQLVAVADPLAASREAFAGQFSQVECFENHADLLARKDIDAVVIASSTNTHGKIIMESVDAGKAVFCEKPITLDLKEAAEIKAAVDKKMAFVMIGFMRRFDDAYIAAKRRIDSGELGDPVYVHGVSRDPGCPPIEFAKASGGLVLDLAIHDIDLCRWLLNSEVRSLYAKGGVLMWKELGKIGDIDHINIEFEMANGTMAHLEGSRNARYGYDVRTEVICTKGAVFIGDLNNTATVVLNQDGRLKDVVPGFRERFDLAYFNEISRFVQDVRKGAAPAVTVDDGIASIKIAFAVNESNASGMPREVR